MASTTHVRGGSGARAMMSPEVSAENRAKRWQVCRSRSRSRLFFCERVVCCVGVFALWDFRISIYFFAFANSIFVYLFYLFLCLFLVDSRSVRIGVVVQSRSKHNRCRSASLMDVFDNQ
jgi:hypothetical protein